MKKKKSKDKGLSIEIKLPDKVSIQLDGSLMILKGPKGEEIFEAYAEQSTPAAYRIFWYYGPELTQITIIAITSHP